VVTRNPRRAVVGFTCTCKKGEMGDSVSSPPGQLAREPSQWEEYGSQASSKGHESRRTQARKRRRHGTHVVRQALDVETSGRLKKRGRLRSREGSVLGPTNRTSGSQSGRGGRKKQPSSARGRRNLGRFWNQKLFNEFLVGEPKEKKGNQVTRGSRARVEAQGEEVG